MFNIPLEDLENEKKELEKKIFEFQIRLREINNQLTGINTYSELWIQKTFGALNLYNEPLSTDEIIQSIFPSNSFELSNPVSRRSNILKLSTILNRLCNKGRLFSKKYDSYKGNLYFLIDWVHISDDEKTVKIKSEYEFRAKLKISKNVENKNRFAYA